MGERRLSVVIPYYNNDRTLGRCLEAFANEQTRAPDEIVVVDDGSSAPAAPIIAALSLRVPVALKTSEHAGQSRASNIGVAQASGDVVLMSAADIVPTPTLVCVHAVEHEQAQARNESIAVMGAIGYAPWMPMTPFLRYLSTEGPQFSFQGIRDPEAVDGRLLCAPNFSIERDWMRRLGGFDEQLPYGYQDTDLGLRLVQAGVRLMYRESAWAHHDHPNDLANFCRRNRAIGRHVYRVAARHPQLFPRPQIRSTLEAVANTPTLLPALEGAAAEAEALAAQLPHNDERLEAHLFALYQRALAAALHEGMLEGDPRLASWLGYKGRDWQAMRSGLTNRPRASS